MRLFSKLNSVFVGYFHPEKFSIDNDMDILWGDLIDISATKDSLHSTQPVNEASLPVDQ